MVLNYSISIHFVLTLLATFTHGFSLLPNNNNILIVGQELHNQNLPLQMGSRLYKLHDLKSNTWYEVKISYPASIPASFSLQLQKGTLDLGHKFGRKLLNTEKLIFKTDDLEVIDGLSVLVSVEPEGVVAIPNVKEREIVIFNIVCDELLLGIPYQAWYVVGLVVVCIGLAFLVPAFLPSYLLPKYQKIDSKGS